jgi:hypothetical protein
MKETGVINRQTESDLNRKQDENVYRLDLDPIRERSKSHGLIHDMGRVPLIDSQASFNEFCREVCRLWRSHYPEGKRSVTPEFQRLAQQIVAGAIDNQVIQTSWGGVVVTRHQHPDVEKFLVIRQGKFLALEKHAEKDETLEVKEGGGILLLRDGCEQTLAVHELQPGDTFHFKPHAEHCVIGTEDLLLFERSTDPLGMDRDLLFIYTPEEG